MPTREPVLLKVYFNDVEIPSARVHMIESSLGGTKWDHAIIDMDLGWNKSPVFEHIQDLTGSNSLAKRDPGIDSKCLIVGQVGSYEKVFHWGIVENQSIDIGEGEDFRIISRTSEVCFGFPLGFQRVVYPETMLATWYDPAFGADRGIYSDDEVCFNPEHPIEEKCDPNMRVDTSHGSGSALLSWAGLVTPRVGLGLDYNVFISPDSCRTTLAKINQQAVYHNFVDSLLDLNYIGHWSLIDATMYLCGECNSPKKWTEHTGGTPHITNPTLAELSAASSLNVISLGGLRGLLRSHKIPAGLHLPEALDHLLSPYGFTWYVKHIDRTHRKIVVIPKGSSATSVPLLLQKPEQKLDTDKTHAYDIKLDFDAGKLANRVRVVGAKTQIESTFLLQPGWPESLDDFHKGKRAPYFLPGPSDPEWETRLDLRPVWRKWVLNEAGDYPIRRATVAGQPWSTPAWYNLTPLFRTAFGKSHPPVVPRRRKFHATLTMQDPLTPIGAHNHVTVEYYNSWYKKWVEVDSAEDHFSFRLLHDECGIEFTGELAPWIIQEIGYPKTMVRITATIESDYRISYTAAPSVTASFIAQLQAWWNLLLNPAASAIPTLGPGWLSPASRPREITVLKEKSFHARALVKPSAMTSAFDWPKDGSKYYDLVKSGQISRQEDSRPLVVSLAEYLRDANDYISCHGPVSIEGMDRPQYALGVTISKISGREIDLDTSLGRQGGRQPQVIQVRYFPQNQFTTIHLESFGETDAMLAHLVLASKMGGSL